MEKKRKKALSLLKSAALALGIAAALPLFGQSAHAQQSEQGLKDVYANYFRIGTCYPYQAVNDQTLRNVILREFNSITHENDMKPDATMQQSGSTDDDIKVQLNANARTVIAACTTYKIPLRGHTLVWHSQTPQWFFYANMQSGNQNQLATTAVMLRRMESYIKNMFALIKQDFPTLNLYAYDVVNEILQNDGKPRTAGFGGDNSPWVSIFGNNSFADSAFVYARKYAPANCKLFYNDFNEYHPDGKVDTMAAMGKRLKDRGVLDGIGMQSHLSTDWPPLSTYKAALNKFIGTGCEIHVTELDITLEGGNNAANEAKQVALYEGVFKAMKEAREEGAPVTSVAIWGVTDDRSWRGDRNPLLFTSNYTKKPAYNAVAGLIPQKDWGDGKNPPFNTPKPGVVEPDANGFFFYHSFDDAAKGTQGWGRRGDETVARTTAQKNSGTGAIYISGRTALWNGAAFSLPDREFKPGDKRSFSVMARHEGSGPKAIKLQMQHKDLAGADAYPNIATAENAAPNTWVQIANTNFTIPAGTGFSIYVELDDANASFYIDDAMGGIAGATIKPDGTPGGMTSIAVDKNMIRGHSPLVTAKGRVLTVNGSPDSKVRIKVVNLTGKTVAKFNARGGADVSLKKLPAGTYVVEASRIKDGVKTASTVVLK